MCAPPALCMTSYLLSPARPRPLLIYSAWFILQYLTPGGWSWAEVTAGPAGGERDRDRCGVASPPHRRAHPHKPPALPLASPLSPSPARCLPWASTIPPSSRAPACCRQTGLIPEAGVYRARALWPQAQPRQPGRKGLEVTIPAQGRYALGGPGSSADWQLSAGGEGGAKCSKDWQGPARARPGVEITGACSPFLPP